MLLQAMNAYQVASREYKEAKKVQYTDMTGGNGAKNYFRASELGSGDRKIIYSFFRHQLDIVPKSAKNLRQLENGDYVHERYQKAWDEMGALLSMEERVSSKTDETLMDYPWEWAGHYDGLLDMNVLRAHALGKTTVSMRKDEETGEWVVDVDIDDDFAKELGIFEDGYDPVAMVADIKTMNPFSFKSLIGGNLSKIEGYIDQLSFYMYMLNTPYGSIFVEDKGSNETCEVQVVWTDLHEDIEYVFDPKLHGEIEPGILRVVINNDRFFGSDKEVGLVPRIDRLWKVKESLVKIDAGEVDNPIQEVMPMRCCQNPDEFPCSWSKGAEKCEFFDHCWNDFHQGCALHPHDDTCPEELIWELQVPGGEVKRIDSRMVPQGMTIEMFTQLYQMAAMDITKFIIKDTKTALTEAGDPEAEAEAKADAMFNSDGELNLAPPPAPSETVEYTTSDNKRAIICVECRKEIVYTRLGAGNTKACPFCKHTNKVIKN